VRYPSTSRVCQYGSLLTCPSSGKRRNAQKFAQSVKGEAPFMLYEATSMSFTPDTSSATASPRLHSDSTTVGKPLRRETPGCAPVGIILHFTHSSTHYGAERGAATGPVSPMKGRRMLIPPLIPYLTPDDLLKPTPPIVFPLSPDHHLITLVQVCRLEGYRHVLSLPKVGLFPNPLPGS
jgi:hypothetical protein